MSVFFILVVWKVLILFIIHVNLCEDNTNVFQKTYKHKLHD